ncbi:MAG: hypothetical protein J7M40_16655 [Planctomycetes bacterium]|nr:hypothetical protein [Planctomycetota bacterium]
MNIRKYIFAVAMALAAWLVGCSSQQVAIPAPGPLSVAGVNKTRVMSVAEDVLTQMHFTVEKADTEKGYIRTRPLRGGQLFEVWRKDNASAAQLAEANLHSIQRTVELNITESGGGVQVKCDVGVRRLSLPENDHVARSRAANMFTASSTAIQRLTVNPEQAQRMEWIELGPDPALETRILQLIQRRTTGSEG